MSISLLNTTLNPTSSVYSQINSNFQFLQSGLNGFIPFSSGNSFVKTAGNQTISGVKNFASRPTVNGVGVVLQNEITGTSGPINTSTFVQTVGNQTIGGKKTFTSGIVADVDIPAGNNVTFFGGFGQNNFDIGTTTGSYSDSVLYLKSSSTNATLLKIAPEVNPARIEFPSLPLGQKHKVLIGNETQNNSVTILELNSTTQGFLPPRLTTSQRNALMNQINSGNNQTVTPILPAGLTIYNTTSKTIEVYDGVAWNSLSKDGFNDGFSLVKIGLQVPKRKTFTVVTPLTGPGQSAFVDLQLGAFRGYFLYSITASKPSWSILYKNMTDRTNDSGRSQITKPSITAGVMAESVNLTSNSTTNFTPAPLGWVDSTNFAAGSYPLPIRVQNNTNTATSITLLITLVPTDADENLI